MTIAAFSAAYADWKLVKTRSVIQVIFEVPIENADTAYQVVGGMPNAATERWFAIARLNHRDGEEPKLRKPVAPDKRLAQQAGILCNDPVFHAFLRETHTGWKILNEGTDPERAALIVRSLCGVKSRAEIVPGSPAATKWNEVAGKFEAWKVA